MQIPRFDEIIEPNDQTQAREEHLNRLRELVGNVYPNRFERSRITGDEDTISAIKKFEPVVEVENEMAEVKAGLSEGQRPPAEIKDAINGRLKALGNVRIAGRLTTPPRGNFVHLTDGMAKLQIYCKKGQFVLLKNDAENTPDEENAWTAWGLIDHGDFVGVEGYLFVTNTGEVSVHVEKLQFLAKAMLPMPDKMHGIEDAEIKQRQRYVDLLGSSLAVETEGMTTRQVFEARAKLVSSLRRFLEDHGYVEVETPMLTPKATGAAAKPFQTHHNALDITLYARIAPELYLKRLVVGGFEKVYELNRNFRNEGISFKHNPEFTMLEFYCAYMDVNGMMDFCETLLQESVQTATGGMTVEYEGKTIDFSRFERISMKDAVRSQLSRLPRDFKGGSFPTATLLESDLEDIVLMSALAEFSRQSESTRNLVGMMNDAGEAILVSRDKIGDYEAEGYSVSQSEIDLGFVWELKVQKLQHLNSLGVSARSDVLGRALVDIFDNLVEKELVNPTFIIDFPKSISPLSKASPDNPQIAERFELFINGMEVANGFSELNDPREQFERFVDQMAERERGDEEAMVLDEDYIRALSYGMPPTAGIGIGVDRLTMLLTNRHSIRDVILFPHLRPEKKGAEKAREPEEENS